MSTITDIQGTFELNNGVQMPYLGLGVYQAEEGGEVERAVQWALEAGYRHIDTARAYGNEAGVGKALRESGVDREEVFVTSKVWNSDQGYESTLKAFDSTMDDLASITWTCTWSTGRWRGNTRIPGGHSNTSTIRAGYGPSASAISCNTTWRTCWPTPK